MLSRRSIWAPSWPPVIWSVTSMVVLPLWTDTASCCRGGDRGGGHLVGGAAAHQGGGAAVQGDLVLVVAVGGDLDPHQGGQLVGQLLALVDGVVVVAGIDLLGDLGVQGGDLGGEGVDLRHQGAHLLVGGG